MENTNNIYKPKRLHIIVNPHGGKKQGLEVFEQARPIFEESGLRLIIHETEYSGHAKVIANTLDFIPSDAMVSVGGDGTIHEVVNGMMTREDSKRVPIGILPAGSGNDFALALKIKRDDPILAAKKIIEGSIRSVDLGFVSAGDKSTYAVVVLIWGFMVDVTACAERNRWMGLGRYTLAGFHEFWKQTPRPATLKFGDRVIKDRFSLFYAFNTEAGGRETIVATEAKVDDGLWDIVFCRELNKVHLGEVLALMQKGDGSFLKSKHVEYYQVKDFALAPDNPEPINVDGEWTEMSPVKLDIMPGMLKVFSD